MNKQSKNLEKNSSSFKDLLQPIAGKPALLAAMVIVVTFVSIKEPNYAFLLVLLAFLTFFFKRFQQIIILVFLILGFCSHYFLETNVINLMKSEVPQNACGYVQSVLPRSNGYAFIIAVKDSLKTDYSVRLTEKRELMVMPEPGDSICYEASWYPINPPTVPGAFDTKNWLISQNISAYGKFIHWKSWRGKWNSERMFHRFRNNIKQKFSRFLDSSETGLLMGLLAGDRSGIPEALKSDFQRSGLVHVLAISGFHVVLLAGLLMTLLKATGMPHNWVRIIGVALLFVYIPITGGSPAVRRAVIMFSVPQIGMIFQRKADALNSLGVALIFLLIPEPSVLWNPGFQLSVAATLGIILGSTHNPLNNLPKHLKKNKVWGKLQTIIVEPIYVTFCATLATAPFLIHHFKTLSPLSWLGNIIIVPLISWGMEAGLFALFSPFDLIKQNFCCAASFLLRLASYLTSILSSSTIASITVGPFPPYILLLMGIIFLLSPALKKNKSARIFSAVAVLLFSIFFFWENYKKVENPSWILTAIDIGQGDGILLSTPGNKHFLIDTGPSDRKDSGKDIIVPYLRHLGVIELDAIIVTHPDADHFGGTLGILQSIPIKEIWLSECARLEPKPAWLKTMSIALEKGIPLRDVGRGFVWSDNFLEIRALHPNIQGKCGETNEESVTLRVKGLGHSAILTGDLTVAGERKILKSNAFLSSDVLKIGHHGSKTSSSREFLEAINPKLALISSGRKNRFRHPHKQVVDRLDSLQIPFLNTAEKGTISVVFSKDSIWVKTMLP